jgi:hypothetical protein
MKPLAIIAMLLWSTAVCAHTQTMTLNCKGKVTIYGNSNSQSVTNMVLVVNLAEKTLTGFDDLVANIYIVNASYISFKTFGETKYVYGSMDRRIQFVSAATGENAINRKWELTCTTT